MRLRFGVKWLVALLFLTTSCMKWDYEVPEGEYDIKSHGLFIINEGNFQYGNASLSFYVPETDEVLDHVFYNANGMKLGDVAQSMTVYDGKGWIAVNNSHVVFAIDLDSFKELGRIENLTSPRYIHFISDHKAYITQLWDNRIFIVDPTRYTITGYIEVPGMSMETGSTEQMVQVGPYVYCNCWSYQNSILKIDTRTDKVVSVLEVGRQPKYLALDKNEKLWVLTDGGLEGSVYGREAPSLLRIDPENFEIEKKFLFKLEESPYDLQVDCNGEELYWINDDVWRMSVDSELLPLTPFLPYRNTRYFALTVSPYNGDVYVADAIDYMQPGMILRYSNSGTLLGSFYAGVTPGAFCWK